MESVKRSSSLMTALPTGNAGGAPSNRPAMNGSRGEAMDTIQLAQDYPVVGRITNFQTGLIFPASIIKATRILKKIYLSGR